MVASKFVISSVFLAAFASALRARDNNNPVDVIVNGVKSGVTNVRQQVDAVVRGFQTNDGHPTADSLKALITGLDGQIDNGIGIVADLLSPVTFGASHAVEGAILGPFFQSVTDGAEVAISNLVGLPIDAVLGSDIQSLANNMSKMIAQANQLQVDKNIVSNMVRTQQRVAAFVPKHKKREVAVLDGVQTRASSASQAIDNIITQLQKSGGVSPVALASAVNGVETQMDNALVNIDSLLAPISSGMSSTVSSSVLAPLFDSISTGAEAIISNASPSATEEPLSTSLGSFAKSLASAASYADKYNLQEQKRNLISLNHRVQFLIKQKKNP